jgi:hypothetical protein
MQESKYSSILISNHQFQGKKNDCGPFCAAIILSALSQNKTSGSDLSNQLNQIQWKGIVPVIYRIPNWATFPWGIARWLRDTGINARWKFFVKAEYLRANLQKTIFIVTIGNLFPLWAHYKILTAFHADLGWGFVDPALNRSAIFWQTNDRFISQWNVFGRSVIEIKAGD